MKQYIGFFISLVSVFFVYKSYIVVTSLWKFLELDFKLYSLSDLGISDLRILLSMFGLYFSLWVAVSSLSSSFRKQKLDIVVKDGLSAFAMGGISIVFSIVFSALETLVKVSDYGFMPEFIHNMIYLFPILLATCFFVTSIFVIALGVTR